MLQTIVSLDVYFLQHYKILAWLNRTHSICDYCNDHPFTCVVPLLVLCVRLLLITQSEVVQDREQNLLPCLRCRDLTYIRSWLNLPVHTWVFLCSQCMQVKAGDFTAIIPPSVLLKQRRQNEPGPGSEFSGTGSISALLRCLWVFPSSPLLTNVAGLRELFWLYVQSYRMYDI